MIMQLEIRRRRYPGPAFMAEVMSENCEVYSVAGFGESPADALGALAALLAGWVAEFGPHILDEAR